MPQRRLTAILAADVVGYSRLMGDDETGTLDALKAHRENLFNPEIRKRGGRTVKLMGDGVLVEFPSVVDAVEAAVSVQRALAQEAGPIQLRIGINLGDVIVDGDEIYGDGVNVAARLEAEAEPGGICIASIVHESIRNRVGAAFHDAGEIDLKNIEHPVHAFQWAPDPSSVRVKSKPIKSQPAQNRSMRTIAIASVVGLVVGGGITVFGVQMMQGDGPKSAAIIPAVATQSQEPVPEPESVSRSSEQPAGDTAPATTTKLKSEKPAPTPPETDVGATTSPALDKSEARVTETKPDLVYPETPEATEEPTQVPGGEIAGLLAGKVLRGGSEFGGKRFELRLAPDGAFRGKVSFEDAFDSAGVDNGRWTIRDDALCIRFFVFANGRQVCAMVMRDAVNVTFKTPNGSDRNWTLSE